MSKGNLFLGFGRGAVGDVVMYRANGEQITRARNRHPSNPQTALQLLQRVVLKTSSMAYGLMQEICNHSFQGFAEGTECQSRFNKLNIQRFREQLVNEINSGDADEIVTSAESNFSYNGASLVEMNPYRISEGTLTSVPVTWGAAVGSPSFIIAVDLGSAEPTYNDVLSALGIVSGDQLTFVGLSCDDTVEGGQFNGFDYARVIMEPASGDLSLPFLVGGAVNDPNEKNRGSFEFTIESDGSAYYLSFTPADYSNDAGVRNAVAGASVILSRNNGSVWQRSSQSLVLRPDIISVNGHLNLDHSIDYLGDAVQSFMSDTSSLLYLNQAGGSGKRGQVVVTPKLIGLQVDSQSVARGGSLVVRSGNVSISAVLSGASGESSYALAIIANGSESPYKQVDFTSTSATISDAALVEDTEYAVVLLEDGVVVDTYASVSYQTVAEPSISAVTAGGSAIARDASEMLQSGTTIVVTASHLQEGVTYNAALIQSNSSQIVMQANFSGNTATLANVSLDNNQNVGLWLRQGSNNLDKYCNFYSI